MKIAYSKLSRSLRFLCILWVFIFINSLFAQGKYTICEYLKLPYTIDDKEIIKADLGEGFESEGPLIDIKFAIDKQGWVFLIDNLGRRFLKINKLGNIKQTSDINKICPPFLFSKDIPYYNVTVNDIVITSDQKILFYGEVYSPTHIFRKIYQMREGKIDVFFDPLNIPDEVLTKIIERYENNMKKRIRTWMDTWIKRKEKQEVVIDTVCPNAEGGIDIEIEGTYLRINNHGKLVHSDLPGLSYGHPDTFYRLQIPLMRVIKDAIKVTQIRDKAEKEIELRVPKWIEERWTKEKEKREEFGIIEDIELVEFFVDKNKNFYIIVRVQGVLPKEPKEFADCLGEGHYEVWRYNNKGKFEAKLEFPQYLTNSWFITETGEIYYFRFYEDHATLFKAAYIPLKSEK